MFIRRRTDSQQPKTEAPQCSPDLVLGLRRLVVMLLKAFSTFSCSVNPQETQEIKDRTSDYITQLQNVDAVEPLEALHQNIRKLIYNRQEMEQKQSLDRLEAMKELMETVADGLSEIDQGSEQFTELFDHSLQQHLGAMQRFASPDIHAEFAEWLKHERMRFRSLIETKRKREQKLTQSLQERVQALEEQLMSANEQLVLDGLTQVYNRRALDARLQAEVKYCTTHGGSFTLLLFDVDHFKQVNDEHGHLVGDRTLQALAKVARSTFRIEDFIGRYGGEEFVVLLNDVTRDYAIRIAERFRLAVAQKAFLYQRDETKRSLRLTISIGLANFREGDTAESLFDRADRMLYRAKRNGRNRTETDAHGDSQMGGDPV